MDLGGERTEARNSGKCSIAVQWKLKRAKTKVVVIGRSKGQSIWNKIIEVKFIELDIVKSMKQPVISPRLLF
jgi:hypothetical protein